MLAQRLGLPHLRGAGSFVVATFIDTLGTGLFLPFSLLYFNQVVGLPLSTAGLALSLAMIITVPMVPVAGMLIDRFGAKRVVLLAQLLQGAGVFGYLIVNSAAMLMGMALLVASGQGLFWSAHFSLVAQIAAQGERDRWYGLAAATRNAGLGLGGLLAGVLVGANAVLGYHLVVVANGLSFFLAAGLLGLGMRVSSPQRNDSTPGYGYLLFPWLVMAGLILCASLTLFWLEPRLPQSAVHRQAAVQARACCFTRTLRKTYSAHTQWDAFLEA